MVDDLTRSTDDELRSRAMGLFATLAAIFLRDARTPDRVIPMLHRIATLLGQLLRAPDGPRAVTLLLRYLSLVADVGVDQVTQVVQQTVPEAKDLVMTIAEQLRQQGVQQGIQQGRLADLRRVLELRFGALDPDLAGRLEAITAEDLERLFDRAVTAPSIDQFLGDE